MFGHIARIVVRAVVFTDFVTQIVPLHARRLASFAAYAFGDVDQFGDGSGDRFARGWWLNGGGREPFNIKRLK